MVSNQYVLGIQSLKENLSEMSLQYYDEKYRWHVRSFYKPTLIESDWLERCVENDSEFVCHEHKSREQQPTGHKFTIPNMKVLLYFVLWWDLLTESWSTRESQEMAVTG